MITKVLLIGAGNIGGAIAFMLAESGDYTTESAFEQETASSYYGVAV